MMMKPNNDQNNIPAQHDYSGKHRRPENKDTLDSREGEEQDIKKNGVTHNKKETKEGKLHNRLKKR